MGVGVYAENNEYDSLFLSNYLDVFVRDALKRIPGVADVTIFGERKYAMRVWLDPDPPRVARADRGGRERALCASRTCRLRPAPSASRPRPAISRTRFRVRAAGRLTEPRPVRKRHPEEQRRHPRAPRATSAAPRSEPRRTRAASGSTDATRSASAWRSCRRPTPSTSTTV